MSQTTVDRTHYRVAFTGTRKGMTPEQTEAVRQAIRELVTPERDLSIHHGDAIGADSDMHVLAIKEGVAIHIHPVVNDPTRAHNKGAQVTNPPRQDFRERDNALVSLTNILIAAPRGKREERRSGTWATIRHARKVGATIVFCYPDGSSEIEVEDE